MITAERLRELLHYEPDTGVFTRRVRTANRVRVGGDVAGSVNSSDGYRYICIDYRLYPDHRLAWLYITGSWPKSQIDHINGDKTDNRLANLREATQSQNQANTSMRADNISGFKGVSWSKGRRKWLAHIKKRSKCKHLGFFDTSGSAALAYTIAAEKHFGEFGKPMLEDTCLGIFMDAWRDARWKFDWAPVTGLKRKALERSVLWNLANPDPNYMIAA
jgi:HNH endonuclease/AP2 domain